MSGFSRRNVWLQHAVVAVGYALGYALLRQVSWSHWALFAGYRLSVLLLTPYRYWPALVVGELGPVGYASLSCIETFGWLWSGVMLVPPIALAMPAVKFCRDRLGMIPAKGPVQMGIVLSCTLVVSGLWTLANAAALSVAHLPSSFPPIDYNVEFSRWFVGNFLGVLTVVPLLLVIRGAWSKRADTLWGTLSQVRHSPLILETLAFLLPVLALLVWIGLDARSEASRQMAQMLMFLPVVALALRHGWHGVAIGGTAASLGVVLTMPEHYDTNTLQSEVFVAFAISSMLLFGSRIASLRRVGRQQQHAGDQSLDLARRIHTRTEVQLRQASEAIGLVSESVHATEELMFERLRKLGPMVDTRDFRRRTTASREQLFQVADGLHPITLKEHGLIAALRHGGVARALNTHRIGYWVHLRGNTQQLQQLSKSMQLGLYRIICEAANHLCASHSVSDLTVQIRGGQLGGRRWTVIRMDALFSNDPGFRVHDGPLLYRLAATGLGIDAIRDHAVLYDGTVRTRTTSHGELISMLLYEPDVQGLTVVARTKRPNATTAFLNVR
jgi:glucose-6-phosphate-specific signal transduction histidine kinase